MRQPRAGEEQAALIGKMRIERVPLNAGALGDHAERRLRRADAAVQIDRGFDDALPGLRLLLGAALEGVGPCHSISLHTYVHPLLTSPPNFTTHICTMKLSAVHRRRLAPVNPLIAWRNMETKISEIADGIYRLSTYRAGHRPARRLHLQPVSGPRRRAADVPHRPAQDVPAQPRRRQPHHPARAPALDRLRPLRGRRVRRDERMARGRAAGDRPRTARPAAWCRSTISRTARRAC